MNLGMILKIIAALATVATGLLAFVKPAATYGFIGLNANGVRGVSEIRAIFGGWSHRAGTRTVVPRRDRISNARHWLSCHCGGARVLHVFDRSYAQSNIISLAIEIVLGAILIL